MTKLRSTHLKAASLAAVLVIVSLAYGFASQAQPAYHGVAVLASADNYAAVGDNVTYQIIAYNPLDFDLYNVTVIAELLGLNETIPFMSAGNKTGVTYTLHRTVLQSDPDPLVSTVMVEAIDSQGVRSSASTQAKTSIIKRLLELAKTGPGFAHEGDSIEYMISVKNLADSLLANVTVKDEMLGFGWAGDLAVNESNFFSITYFVQEHSADPLNNTVTAMAFLNETLIYAEKSWTVDILHPSIKVEKTAVPNRLCEHESENVTYTINTTNTGDTPLYNITLIDTLLGPAPAELIPASLLPGDFFTWTYSATIDECTLNIAEATGVDILGKQVSASAKAFVVDKPTVHPKGLGYWKNHPSAWPASEIKTGNVTLTQEEALTILQGANAKDAARMLAAMLIVAKLNRLSGTCPTMHHDNKTINIDDTIREADAFLADHPVGSNPQCQDRHTALCLKNLLAAYSEHECD